jgi:hypothetical protein
MERSNVLERYQLSTQQNQWLCFKQSTSEIIGNDQQCHYYNNYFPIPTIQIRQQNNPLESQTVLSDLDDNATFLTTQTFHSVQTYTQGGEVHRQNI